MIIVKMYNYQENIIHKVENYIFCLAIAFYYILSYSSQDIWVINQCISVQALIDQMGICRVGAAQKHS